MIKKISILALGLVFLASCAEEPEDPNTQSDYMGVWDVTEKTGINAPQIYSVQIQAGATEDEIIIKGLYNFPNVSVMAEIDGHLINIPIQSSEGINFSGSGNANADFDQLNIDFVANDGSGNDNVNAVFIR